MKVIPRKKSKKLKQDEARIITVNKAAIEELLLENLLEHKNEYFDIKSVTDDDICLINWDQCDNILTYAVMPIKYCFDGYSLNFEKIRKKIGITTDSLFKSRRYCSVSLTSDFLYKAEELENSFLVSSGTDPANSDQEPTQGDESPS